MDADDFDIAANEQRDEKKVKEMSQPNPQRKTELKGVVHNGKLPPCDAVKLECTSRYLSRALREADGAERTRLQHSDKLPPVQAKCRMSTL